MSDHGGHDGWYVLMQLVLRDKCFVADMATICVGVNPVHSRQGASDGQLSDQSGYQGHRQAIGSGAARQCDMKRNARNEVGRRVWVG